MTLFPELMEKVAKAVRAAPTPASAADRAVASAKFGELATKVTWSRDADGVYCRTHRARSRSYPTVAAMPLKAVQRIESTG